MSKQVQTEMQLMGQIDLEIRDLPAEQVAHCSHWAQAIRLCMDRSRVRRTQDSWAELLGMTRGALNTILNSDTAAKREGRERYLSIDLATDIQVLAGNRAIEQYMSMRRQGLLNCQRPVMGEIELLEEQLRLARIRASAA